MVIINEQWQHVKYDVKIEHAYNYASREICLKVNNCKYGYSVKTWGYIS